MGNTKLPAKNKIAEKNSFLGLRSLEEEIKFLKANFHRSASKKGKAKTGFASLEGIWREKTNLSYDEVKSAKVKFKGI